MGKICAIFVDELDILKHRFGEFSVKTVGKTGLGAKHELHG